VTFPELPQSTEIVPGIHRVLAPNPGMMTGPGTNSYILGEEAATVIDPGPADESHIDAILDCARNGVSQILVTHTHRDHSPAASRLAERTGACVIGRPAPNGFGQDPHFRADRVPGHNEKIETAAGELTAICTPGHASNHVCYLLHGSGLLFTGDHIMNGSTVVIAPPDGDMSAYIASLELLKAYDLEKIAPGHGDLIQNPLGAIEWLIEHRLEREAKVLTKVDALGSAGLDELVGHVYDDVPVELHRVAKLSLEAHLNKLVDEQRVRYVEDHWVSLADSTRT
jgi:glyoxylase-like metal-dependent hydrolase (beta-lactamase superfamily II)